VAVPFRTLAARLGTREDVTAARETVDPERLRPIAWAIVAVSARTPWRSMCLEQAIAAKAMLRRRRLPSTL